MSKKLAVKEAQAPAVVDKELMDNDQFIDPNDILLPKILVMQGLSQLVADDKARMGEFRESLDGKLLGDAEKKPVEIIPFYIRQEWVIFGEKEGQMQYIGTEPYNAANADAPWDYEHEGTKYRRDKCINVYCMLPGELESGEAMPYLVSFRRTSYKTGRKFQTHKLRSGMLKKPLASNVFHLTANKVKNEKGTFFVTDAAKDRATTVEEKEAIAPWFNLIKSSNVRVDDSDLKEDAGNTIEVSDVDAKDFAGEI